MPKKMVRGTILGLERDGKPYSPQVNQVEEFSDDEIQQIEAVSPGVLEDPPEDRNDGSNDPNRDANNPGIAETRVETDPVNSGVAGGGDPGGETLAQQQKDPPPAVQSPDVVVKGSKPLTAEQEAEAKKKAKEDNEL